MTKKYKSLTKYKLGDNEIFIVENDERRKNFDDLVGSKVIIDGVKYKCLGVERKLHVPPWVVGEKIGLMARRKQWN